MLVLDSHSDAPSLPLMWLLDPHIRDWSCTTLGGWRRWIVFERPRGEWRNEHIVVTLLDMAAYCVILEAEMEKT